MAQEQKKTGWITAARGVLCGPQALAFIPAISLAAYWLIGEGGLIVAALGLPLFWRLIGDGFANAAETDEDEAQLGTRIMPRDQIKSALATLLGSGAAEDNCAIFLITYAEIDSPQDMMDTATLLDLRDQITRRLKSLLRADDMVVLSGHLDWVVALRPGARLDLEVAIQQASRLQSVVDDPLFIGRARHYLTSTIGFKLAHLSAHPIVEQVLTDVEEALMAALAAGPGSIRAHTARLEQSAPKVPSLKRKSAEPTPKIVAWFQPQVSTDTGTISGFEALARLDHPEKGILPPAAFLPEMEAAGQLEMLSDTMLKQGLGALQVWDREGLHVDTVGINYSAQDLANPQLYDKIAWELDRNDISPHRLSIEILENVVAAGADDMITRNVIRLAGFGCQIDLDDFGTGHASISTLKRLPVSRLKIDRTFVTKSDRDSEQQKLVATILMMAERLGLRSLAEGVETVGEHAILAQLGCDFVQGYGIAKPMPLAETVDWIKTYEAKLRKAPNFGRKSG